MCIYFAYRHALIESRHMGKIAKLFRNGGSQAVRLPAEFRLDCEEVIVEQVGDTLILRPRRHDWKSFFDDPDVAPEDFLRERDDEPPQERELP